MLVGVGSTARRHATNEVRARRAAHLTTLRLFSSSRDRCHTQELPYLRPGQFQPRPHADAAVKEIAVLGGGITGLSTAYNLAKSIPHANITVYEKSHRFGGWIDSEVVPVKGGEVLFEWGPRSLRPSLKGAGWATVNLLDSLIRGRDPSTLIVFHKTSKAATGRFLYYPDHLVRMPNASGNGVGTLIDLMRLVWSEPIFSGVFWGIVMEPSHSARPPSKRDESVGDFLKRRFGPELTDNIASAVMHGIYAGDIYSLSARTLLPHLWYLETRDPENETVILEALRIYFNTQSLLQYEDVKFRNMTPASSVNGSMMLPAFNSASVLTWPDGMEFMVQKLMENLSDEPRVELKKQSDIRSISYDKHKIHVTDGSSSKTFDYAVSTLSPGTMKRVIQPQKPSSLDTFIPIDKSVSVMVVNLWYGETVLKPENEGFGYLIPRSVPLEENPERALGVIFAHNLSGDSTEVMEYTREDREATTRSLEESIEERRQEFMKHEASLAGIYEKAPQLRNELEKQKSLMQKAIEDDQQVCKDYKARNAQLPDVVKIKAGQDTVRGSKIAVMLGGHWWNGWAESDYPSQEEGIAMAKSLLRRQLNIEIEPEVAKARLQKDCIPQYPVGYRDMMAEIHKEVLMKEFHGRLKVAGPWYQGAVGVNDCIRRAQKAAIDIREGWDQNTGLEVYLEDEKWLLEDRDSGEIKVDPMSVS